MSNPVGFARQTLIFLVMQTADASINMRLKRNWFWPFGKVLSSEGKKLPVYIPQANTFTEKVAKMFNGHPITTITEILFNVPFTAHCMGGCAIASSPEQGVVDGKIGCLTIKLICCRRLYVGCQFRCKSKFNYYCSR